jgi:hypothetical protein
MSDEIFRPRRAPETEHPSMEPASPHFCKTGRRISPGTGTIFHSGQSSPPEFLAALQNQQRQVPPQPQQPQQNFTADNSLARPRLFSFERNS